jgi:type II secretory pathway predicted ATPase ExeA
MMEPLALEETPQYIRHQLKNAGKENRVFSDAAMASVYDYSKGIISTINLLCYMTLIKAAGKGKEIIDQCDIEVVRSQDR